MINILNQTNQIEKMNTINLNEVTEFIKIKDIKYYFDNNKDILCEFLNNVVIVETFNGKGNMLSDFSDIYVLVSKTSFPFDKLSSNQIISINLSESQQNFILGYIWISSCVMKTRELSIPYHFMNFIDTRISGLNMTKHMINKYKYYEKCHLFPLYIMWTSSQYWKKYFIEEYKIHSKTDLFKMITNEHKLINVNIEWNELFLAFDS
jgi:hypothetical protein